MNDATKTPPALRPKKHLSVSMSKASKNYGVNRDTIRATIAKYDHFPIIKDGKFLKFDLDAIDEWLGQNDWWRGTREQQSPDEDVPDIIKKLRGAQNQKEGKTQVQTELLQLELDKKRGLLVEREAVVAVFSYKMARFAKQHELIPNLVGKKTGMTDAQIRLLRDHLDEARKALLKDDEGFFEQMDRYGL